MNYLTEARLARRGRTFTAEFKARVVLALMRGEKSKAALVRDHRLKQSLIEEWQAEFEAKASQIFAQPGAVDPQEARIAELERHVGKLSLELDHKRWLGLVLLAAWIVRLELRAGRLLWPAIR
jgi:transposase-like protein